MTTNITTAKPACKNIKGECLFCLYADLCPTYQDTQLLVPYINERGEVQYYA